MKDGDYFTHIAIKEGDIQTICTIINISLNLLLIVVLILSKKSKFLYHEKIIKYVVL